MWTWCGKMGLSMEAKTRWQLKLHTSPMLVFLIFCKVKKEGDMQITVKWNISKNLSLQEDVKKITLDIFGMVSKPKPFPLVIFTSLKLVVLVFFYLIEWKLCFVGINVFMS